MNKKNQIRNTVLILTAVVAILLLVALANERNESVSSFSECVEAGNPVMESYPRQCQADNGEVFVEDVSPTEKPEQEADE